MTEQQQAMGVVICPYCRAEMARYIDYKGEFPHGLQRFGCGCGAVVYVVEPEIQSEEADPKFLKMIQAAKHQVELWYECVGQGRRWLKSAPIDSYGDANYRVELVVLEGSAAKGYVVADWGNRTVRAQCLHTRTKLFKQAVW